MKFCAFLISFQETLFSKNTNRYKDHVFYNEQILEKNMMGTPRLPLTFSGNNGSKNVIQKLILEINPNRIPYTNQSASFPTRKCFSIHFLSIKREKKDLLPNGEKIQEIEKELIILDVNIFKLSQCIANYFIPI